MVTLFFIHNVLATLLLGGIFSRQKNATFRNFGMALLMNAVAFGIWSMAVISKSDNLETYVTSGVIFLLASFVFFILSATQELTSTNRNTIVGVSVIIAAIVMYLRVAIYPSTPDFSADGYFFFNPHPMIQYCYIFGICFTVIPAADAVSKQFKEVKYGRMILYGFIAEVAGSIVLLTSNSGNPDTGALQLTGWTIGVVYLILWPTFLFGKNIWPTDKIK